MAVAKPSDHWAHGMRLSSNLNYHHRDHLLRLDWFMRTFALHPWKAVDFFTSYRFLAMLRHENRKISSVVLDRLLEDVSRKCSEWARTEAKDLRRPAKIRPRAKDPALQCLLKQDPEAHPEMPSSSEFRPTYSEGASENVRNRWMEFVGRVQEHGSATVFWPDDMTEQEKQDVVLAAMKLQRVRGVVNVTLLLE